MSSYERDIEQVKLRATAQGFRVIKTANGHWQFYSPNKHDIVTASKTASDHRSWLNFMAQMKRAGYVAEEQQNGHTETVMEAAMKLAKARVEDDAHHEPVAAEAPKQSLPSLIVEALRPRGALGMNFDLLATVVKSKRPGTLNRDVSSALWHLKDRKTVEQKERGWYRLRSDDTASPPPVIQPSVIPETDGQPPVAGSSLPTEPPAPSPANAVASESVASDDDDLAAIDEALAALSALEKLADLLPLIPPALAALAKIDGVARRNREVMTKVSELQRLLKTK